MQYVLFCLLILTCSGCKVFESAPKWPTQVKNHYTIIKDDEGFHCFEMEILSSEPYVLGDPEEVDLIKCDTLTGYLPKDMQAVIEYKSKTGKWMETHCQEKPIATVQTETSLKD